VDAEHLRLGRACLREDAPIPALRRKLDDQLDDLARALRVREAGRTGERAEQGEQGEPGEPEETAVRSGA
ncbi:hypothetical protein GTY54_23070, partial [Streptomyces sp. SID625]|nr:hypothetical protein [Streptomyces sp. SID625]